AFLQDVRTADPPVMRLPGTAIFVAPGKTTTPLALRTLVRCNHAMHERIVIVSVHPVAIPHVDRRDRFVEAPVGSGPLKLVHVVINAGYRDAWHVPAALALARKQGVLARNLDLEHASYFVSRMNVVATGAPGMAGWRKRMFVALARNAASPVDAFGLAAERTVVTSSEVPI
ncbi:MAG: KUP/HAK/KT family potassium transporter, partial [Solirubrobacteraceae bacterium]